MKFWACVLAMMVPGIVMADIASTTYTDKALSSKADDSAVVHKTGDEIIGGTKTFSDTIVGISPVAFAAPNTNLRSDGENISLNMYGRKTNRLHMLTENSNSVILSTDDQDDEKIALTMLEKGNPTIELTNNDGNESSALIMKDDIRNTINMGIPYTGDTTLYMVGENTELNLEGEESNIYTSTGRDSAAISMGSPNGAIRLITATGFNNGNPTLGFNNAKGTMYFNLDPAGNLVITPQDASQPNILFFKEGNVAVMNTLLMHKTISPDTDNDTVANTKWVNDRIEDARGVIPVGGADGTETAQIWIE